MAEQLIPSYIGDLIPSVSTYNKALEIYKKGITSRDFYEEPIADDYIYPDWQIKIESFGSLKLKVKKKNANEINSREYH